MTNSTLEPTPVHSIHAHLLKQATAARAILSHSGELRQEEGDLSSAERRLATLERLCASAAKLSSADALALLLSEREKRRARPYSASTDADARWFDGIVDPVAQELVGWIEVSHHGYDDATSRMLYLPAYSRMLERGRCVGGILREKNEEDDVWLARRKTWLQQYNPAVPVRHGQKRVTNGGHLAEVGMGTVSTFASQDHLVEAGLVALRSIRSGADTEFIITSAYWGPDENGAIGEMRQVSGEPFELGPVRLQPGLTLNLVP